MKTEKAIYLIIQHHRQSPFDDSFRFLSYLRDLVPEQKTDIRRIQTAFEIGALELLKRHINDPRLAMHATKQLLLDMDIEESAVDCTISLLSIILNAQNGNTEGIDESDESRPKPVPTNSEDFYNLGEEYFGKNDYDNAVIYYRKAADDGHAEAMYRMGCCCQYHTGELSEAIGWYVKAATYNHPLALKAIDNITTGGGETEYEKAEEAYSRKDYVIAIEHYNNAIEHGHNQSLNALGHCYQFGLGTDKNGKKAMELYLRAAEQGHIPAMYDLGKNYVYGSCGVKDVALGIQWLEKAANSTDDAASSFLAIKNRVEPTISDAQYSLGVIYSAGTGVLPNDSKAAEYYSKAAKKGHAGAEYALGLLYASGRGVQKDLALAKKYLNRAAQKNKIEAWYLLGAIFEAEGNFKDAYDNYDKASQMGHLESGRAKKRISERI